MIKKTVQYEDYNGEKVTEDFYFNLTKTELTKMRFSEKGGLEKYIDKIVNERDSSKMLALFDEIIVLAYGEKSADGKYLMKNDSIRERFKCSPAYDEIFMECLGDTDKVVAFFTAILPKDMQDDAKKQTESLRNQTVTSLNADNNNS